MKYVVEVNNQEEANTVYKHNGHESRDHTHYPVIITNSGMWGSLNYHNNVEGIKEYGPVLNFKTFSQMFSIMLKPSKMMNLTADYSAVVNYTNEVVEVDCQVIPFARVVELYNLINQ